MKWHDLQNDQIIKALDLKKAVHDHESPLMRMSGFLDSFITDKHFLNVLLLKKKDDQFRLLDLGCGAGDLIHRLSHYFRNADFIGIDSNRESLQIANSNLPPNARFILGLYEKMESLGAFDIVICSEVLEHVEDKDQLINTLSSLLKEGGFLSISTPSGWMYRTPRFFNLKMIIRQPSVFFNYYLKPESNWKEAVKIHPAIQPHKLIQLLTIKGFSLFTRQSSLWMLKTKRGILYFLLKKFEKENRILSAIILFNFMIFLESLMGLFPPFRIFESRFVLLMQKNK